MRLFSIALGMAAAIALSPVPALALNVTDKDPPAEQSGDTAVPMPTLSDDMRPAVDDGSVEFLSDLDRLPEPVRRIREKILDACRRGDIEALRALMGSGDNLTQLSFAQKTEDPIEYLKSISGDGEGYEILAILAEVLEEDYVRLDAGTSQELYVWPYFFAHPLDELDGPQRVRLFRLVTGGDYETMLQFGGYNFFRAGFTPDGRWAFFVAGD